MKKDALLSKKAKAIIASAMAMTLAIPSVAMLGGTTPVQAEVELPEAIAVYDFEDASGEGITIVDNEMKPTIGTDAGRSGNVLTLNDTIVVPAVTATRQATDADNNPIVETYVETPAQYTYSEVKVENPFKGMTELEEEPQFPNAENPYWEKGVTISYWQKATDTDSSIISFSNSREGVIHKDDRDKYNIIQLAKNDPNNELVRLGTPEAVTYAGKTYWKDGIAIRGGEKGKEYTILDGCGPLVKFNPEYKGGMYYLKPVEVKGKLGYYQLSDIGSPFDVEKYTDPTADDTLLRTGTTFGGLQLNSSGSWGYAESGEIELFYNTVSAGKTSPSKGNHVAVHTWLETEGGNKTYVDAALVNKPAEWHYVTRVIKNDSIATYIDGVLKDTELYTDRSTVGAVDTNKGFNCGWGYYSSGADYGDADPIINKTATTSIFSNMSSYAILVTGSLEMPNCQLGYNGNTDGMTILELLINDKTTLSFGGQVAGLASIYEYNDLDYVIPTQLGTAIDNVAFFAEPLTNEQVAELYAQAQQGDIKAPEVSPEPSEPVPSEPADTSGPSVTDAPTDAPATDAPTGTPTETPTGAPTDVPTGAPTDVPADVMLGDVELDKDVDLTDAQLALKIALKIISDPTADQIKAGDIDNTSMIELADAQAILKEALKITTNFK